MNKKENVTVNEVERVYDGFFNINKYHFSHALFEGGVSPVITREVFERGHAVVVVPYDPIRNEIVMIEQFRIGALEAPNGPWLMEFVAGMIDPGYTIEQVAEKEAMEEAGLKLLSLEPMLDYLSSPGGTTERIYLYLARVDSAGAGGVHGLEHEDEDIKVHTLELQDAFSLLEHGKVDNAATVIALQWLQLNITKVKTNWGIE